MGLKNSNFFIQYNEKIEKTRKISSICDGRTIWGGDKTINEVRKIWIPERAVELTFADRYSLSVLDLNELTKITRTRFVIVTHHALTMSKMDRLYGITMPEKGISQLVAVDLQKAESMVA